MALNRIEVKNNVLIKLKEYSDVGLSPHFVFNVFYKVNFIENKFLHE